MKKLTCLVAGVAAFGLAASAMADKVELRVVSTGAVTSVTVGNSVSVDVLIQGRVIGDGGGAAAEDGLALWGSNLNKGGAEAALLDLDPTMGDFLMTAPAGDMDNFDRNLGLTNPPGPGEASYTGYSGTLSGVNLLQLGGGQNTIGNTDPPVYPVGPVVLDVANDAWTDLATGSWTTPASGNGQVTLALAAPFANVISAPAPGAAPFPVEAATSVTVVAGLTINFGLAACANTDVDCNGTTNAGDIVVIRAPANFNLSAAAAATHRADTDRNNTVNASDIVLVRAPANFNTSTGACSCTPHPCCP
jgi:hypothetical protein